MTVQVTRDMEKMGGIQAIYLHSIIEIIIFKTEADSVERLNKFVV